MGAARLVPLASVGLLGLLAATGVAGAAVPEEAQLEAGRRIYEQGLLPDGSPLRAMRPEGFVLEGAHAACVTCYRRSGMGSVEGSIDSAVLVPSVAGPVLFVPARFHGTFLDSRPQSPLGAERRLGEGPHAWCLRRGEPCTRPA